MGILVPARLRQLLRQLWLLVLVPCLVVGAALILLERYPVELVLPPLVVLLVVYVHWRTATFLNPGFTLSPNVRELALAKAQLEHVFARSPVPYLRIDKHGRVLSANLAAVRIFDTTTEAVSSLHIFEHLQTEAADTDMTLGVLQQKIKSGISVSDVECRLTSCEEAVRWVRLSIHVDNGANTERLVTLVDITLQKRVDQAKSEFVALAAHQLRTPIAAIRWNIELLAAAGTADWSEKQQKYLHKASENATRMGVLIADFLSASKLETGTFATDPEAVDFTNYLDEVIEEFSASINSKRLQVERNVPPKPVTVLADRRLLHIFTSNLISNACKYTPETGSITIQYQLRDNQIIFSVRDSGIGIPAQAQERLFSKFFRADNARKLQAEGTGLGLYLVKQAAEMVGGSVTVESTHEEGSVFTVIFPHRQAA